MPKPQSLQLEGTLSGCSQYSAQAQGHTCNLTQKVVIERVISEGQPGQKGRDPISTNKNWAGDTCLPSQLRGKHK
jgi:hypothetical protein